MNKLLVDPNQSMSLIDGLSPMTTLRCNPDEPKTCIHPLVSPSGRVLSGFEPSDHKWHRGLWFSIKFVDEDNFWEEDAHTGDQVSLEQPKATCSEDGKWTFEQKIAWRRKSGEDAFLEDRSITVEHAEDAVRLDWRVQLTPQKDIHIDRQPFKGWGGYTGLGLRTTRELHDVRFLSPEGEHEAVLGDSHPWLALDGLLDGPYDGDQPAAAGVLMVVDGKHPRFPVPFYAKSGGGFTFMNPAFLFHEGMDLKAGETLDLKYRIVTVDGKWRDNLAAEVAKGEALFA